MAGKFGTEAFDNAGGPSFQLSVGVLEEPVGDGGVGVNRDEAVSARCPVGGLVVLQKDQQALGLFDGRHQDGVSPASGGNPVAERDTDQLDVAQFVAER